MKGRVRCSGRPLGWLAQQVINEIKLGPLTAREVAARLRVTTAATKYTCSRLHAAGHIVVVERIAVGGAHKKVGRYGIAAPTGSEYVTGAWVFL